MCEEREIGSEREQDKYKYRNRERERENTCIVSFYVLLSLLGISMIVFNQRQVDKGRRTYIFLRAEHCK